MSGIKTAWLSLFLTTGPMVAELSVDHHFAENDGVRIHYVTQGEGPLLVLIHGFPDFWRTWRGQIPALAQSWRVAAMDLRGYNQSDQPKGAAAYSVDKLTGDVAAVIRHAGAKSATVVGHDWGGFIAWRTATDLPEMVDRLVVLNLPHPRGLARELAGNAEQRENSGYARRFQKDDAHLELSAAGLAGWVADADERKLYVQAFERSSFEAMLNYYKANYPREPYDAAQFDGLPPVRRPTLVIHGREDKYLLASGLDRTWEWVDADLTLCVIPGAGHFVQHDASDKVTNIIVDWLNRTR